MKIQVTIKQAEELKKLQTAKKTSTIIEEFVKEKFPVTSPIYDFSLDELLEIFKSGYEVKPEERLQREVGDVYDRKDFEYTIVAKVPHATRPHYYVYM